MVVGVAVGVGVVGVPVGVGTSVPGVGVDASVAVGLAGVETTGDGKSTWKVTPSLLLVPEVMRPVMSVPLVVILKSPRSAVPVCRSVAVYAEETQRAANETGVGVGSGNVGTPI